MITAERGETDAQIAKLQMRIKKLDEEREESIQKAASMEMEMTQLHEAFGKLQDERIDMEQQREEKMTKLQENMDTLRRRKRCYGIQAKRSYRPYKECQCPAGTNR